MNNKNVTCYCGLTFLQNVGIDNSAELIRNHLKSKEHKQAIKEQPVKEHSYVCHENGHLTRINQQKYGIFKEPEKCIVCSSTHLIFVPELSRFLL